MELIAKELVKKYKKQEALTSISFQLNNGIIGLLGQNGAGKSTLMRIIATIDNDYEGIVTCNGIDIKQRPNAIRNIIGYLPQDFGVYDNLSATEFLRYMAAVKGVAKAEERIEFLLMQLNLQHAASKKLKGYSGGMKQRIGIAQALLNDPKILILDEPTVGLDPSERMRFAGMLSELAADRIILLSSHIISDLESVCNQLFVMEKGKRVFFGKTSAMEIYGTGRVFEGTITDSEFGEIKKKYVITKANRIDNGIAIRILTDSNIPSGFNSVNPTLEDSYMSLLHFGSTSTVLS